MEQRLDPPLTPEAFGRALQQARERNGVTLDDIAASTKISIAYLTGLERGDLSRWPHGIFRRAFFRDYLAAIGLSPDEQMPIFMRLFPSDGSHEPTVTPLAADIPRPPAPAPQPTRTPTTTPLTLARAAPTSANPGNGADLRLTLARPPAARDLQPRIRRAAIDVATVLIGATLLWLLRLVGFAPAVALVALGYYSAQTIWDDVALGWPLADRARRWLWVVTERAHELGAIVRSKTGAADPRAESTDGWTSDARRNPQAGADTPRMRVRMQPPRRQTPRPIAGSAALRYKGARERRGDAQHPPA